MRYTGNVFTNVFIMLFAVLRDLQFFNVTGALFYAKMASFKNVDFILFDPLFSINFPLDSDLELILLGLDSFVLLI